MAQRPQPLGNRRVQRLTKAAPLVLRVHEQGPHAAIPIARTERNDLALGLDHPSATRLVERRQIVRRANAIRIRQRVLAHRHADAMHRRDIGLFCDS